MTKPSGKGRCAPSRWLPVNAGSCPQAPEVEGITAHRDLHHVPRTEVAGENALGQGALDELLHAAPHGPRSQLRIEAATRHEVVHHALRGLVADALLHREALGALLEKQL